MAGLDKVQTLCELRPLGKLEQVSASCHHLGFFNNVGLSAHYRLSSSSSSSPSASDLRRLVFAATATVLRKHPILFAIPVGEDQPATSYFAALPAIDLAASITFLQRTRPAPAADNDRDPELDALLQVQHNTSFKAHYGTLPFWRLLILQTPETHTDFTASFIYHHAIGDGVSGLIFHRAFCSALDTASLSVSPSPQIVSRDENAPILPDLWGLHPMPMNPNPPDNAPDRQEAWTGLPIRTPCITRWTSLCLPPDPSRAFFRTCKQHGFSVTAVLASVLAGVLFQHVPEADADALACIIPVNLRPWLQLPPHASAEAIGTYFDATKVTFRRPESSSSSDAPWAAARTAAASVLAYLQHLSPSGEPYTAVAAFQAVPDVSAIFAAMMGQPRDAALELTNVGRFVTADASSTDPPSSRWSVGRVLLSRSSVVGGAAITISAATGGDGSLAVGFSWQEGVVADSLVDDVRQGLASYFRQFASE